MSDRSVAVSRESTSRLDAALCGLLVGVCIVTVWPFCGGPFSDDFSYTKTALDFARSGQFHYNGWATAMVGWQAIWGALFIKLFGFSFNVVRLSLLPFAMLNAYFFHQVLIQFGLSARNAIFGTLTLCLSPLCFLLSTSFMTDLTGLFAVILCLYMCQRAIRAATGAGTVAWLVTAALLNVVTGSVRQTSWLGALVVVPSATWYLRRRANVLVAGIVTTVLSAAVIAACMHWVNGQLYFQPEALFIQPFGTA